MPALPETPVVLLALGDVFVLLFVTLGPPLKVPAAFMSATAGVTEPDARALAVRAFAFAVVTAVVGGLIGLLLMHKWHISTGALVLGGGLVFLMLSLRELLTQYTPPAHAAGAAGVPSAYRIAVPMLLPPYGMAAIIVLLASGHDLQRELLVLALVIAVMVLNLLAMWFARPIMRTIGPIPLQVLGVIIGIMTVGLSIQIIISSLHRLGLIT